MLTLIKMKWIVMLFLLLYTAGSCSLWGYTCSKVHYCA